MSLINDALKKAQRDRDESSKGSPPPRSPFGDAPSPSHGPRRPWWLLVLGVAAVAGGSTWLTTRLLRHDSPVTTASAPVTASPSPTPPPPVVAAVPALPPPLPTLAPTPSPLPLTQLSPAAEQARIQAIVDKLTITAVRITDSGSRALVNDRLLRIGDPLEGLPGVKVKDIQNDRIEFVDTEGRLYTKRR